MRSYWRGRSLERVGQKLHFSATLMVAAGTLCSAFWILSANSWMQTPAGYAINADDQFIAVDWLKVIINPSFPCRLVHMVLAAYLTTALVVGSVSAFHLRKNTNLPDPRVMFSMAMWMATLVASPLAAPADELRRAGVGRQRSRPRRRRHRVDRRLRPAAVDCAEIARSLVPLTGL